MLDQEVRRDLRGLPKDLADTVARHLVAAGELLDEDPERALAHARFARFRASRVAVVREASGLAAYHAGEWAEALSELRASRRMGGEGHVPVMADAERALGRPERALDIARSPEARDLVPDESMELLIVVSGARRDLGEFDAAVVGLQVPELDVTRADPWTPRLFYAYAEALLSAGRVEDAVRAFLDAASTDADGETDAEERASMVGAGDFSIPGLESDDAPYLGTRNQDSDAVEADGELADGDLGDDVVAGSGEDEVDDLGSDPAEPNVAAGASVDTVDDETEADTVDDHEADVRGDATIGDAEPADDTDLAADGEVAGGEVVDGAEADEVGAVGEPDATGEAGPAAEGAVAVEAEEATEPVSGAVPHGDGISR